MRVTQYVRPLAATVCAAGRRACACLRCRPRGWPSNSRLMYVLRSGGGKSVLSRLLFCLLQCCVCVSHELVLLVRMERKKIAPLACPRARVRAARPSSCVPSAGRAVAVCCLGVYDDHGHHGEWPPFGTRARAHALRVPRNNTEVHRGCDAKKDMMRRRVFRCGSGRL